jgi:hypothetical protein
MLTRRFWSILTVATMTAGAAAAQTPAARTELRKELRADFRAEVKALRAGIGATALAAPPAPGGYDTDSFGRNVVFDGLLQSGTVTLQPDCTPFPGEPPLGPDDRCVALNTAPAATSFDLPDIGRLTIPGKSAHSFFCHWLTPIAIYDFANPTGVFQPSADFLLYPYVVVESSVLDDPSLIDPTTGLPFGGKLETSFAAIYQDAQSLDVNQTATRRFSETRVCIGGFLSQQLLTTNYGLTDAQAREVFRHDITLRFGLRGTAALVDSAYVIYGLRVVGD